MGHSPIPFRTGATGDPRLLGRWVYFQDLGAPLFLSDTGAPCKAKRQAPPPKKARKGGSKKSLSPGSPFQGPCVSEEQVDIFVGGPEMHRHALRMGVMWWEGTVR